MAATEATEATEATVAIQKFLRTLTFHSRGAAGWEETMPIGYLRALMS
jgi:hypothetical protein